MKNTFILVEDFNDADSSYRDIYSYVMNETDNLNLETGVIEFENMADADMAQSILKDAYPNVEISTSDDEDKPGYVVFFSYSVEEDLDKFLANKNPEGTPIANPSFGESLEEDMNLLERYCSELDEDGQNTSEITGQIWDCLEDDNGDYSVDKVQNLIEYIGDNILDDDEDERRKYLPVEVRSNGVEYYKQIDSEDELEPVLNALTDEELGKVLVFAKDLSESVEKCNTLNEEDYEGPMTATDIVRFLYGNFPHIEFIAERDLGNGKVKLIFDMSQEPFEGELEDAIENFIMPDSYKLNGGYLYIVADEDGELEESVDERFNEAEYEVIKYSAYDNNDDYIVQNTSKNSAISACKKNGGKEVEAACWYSKDDYNNYEPADKFFVVYTNKNESLDETVEKHDTLNQKIFNGDELDPVVKDKLLEIVDNFKSALEQDGINLDIKDVRIIGSNASYNYTAQSDIDLHIFADLSIYPDQEELVEKIYNAYKALWNNKYDPTIYGHEVEIYVEPYDGE
ncbi:MAG: hypothetical protein IJH34_01400 [Romboutsia sp.]|nr:hypothetical protein [Romboutsia sp.]